MEYEGRLFYLFDFNILESYYLFWMSNVSERIKIWYKSEKQRNPVLTMFFTILVIFIVITLFSAVLSGGKTFSWMFIEDWTDTFNDHFNSVMYSSDNPYTYWKVIYPPLITLVYATIGHYTIPFTVDYGYPTLALNMRSSDEPMMVFVIFMMVSLYVLRLIIIKLTNKELKSKTEILCGLLLFSYPILLCIDRGNCLIYCISFCFLFLMGYQSDNKIIRYLSYISLGIATGIKIFPAIFSILIIKERKWKEFGYCFIIVVAILFLPFLLTDGTPLSLLDTIMNYSTDSAGKDGLINIKDYVNMIPVSVEIKKILGNCIALLVLSLSLLSTVFDKQMKSWKAITIISCNLVFSFSIGTTYVCLYMIFGLIYFLLTEKTNTVENKILVICFSIVFALMPGIDFGTICGYPVGLKILPTIKSMAVITILVVLLVGSYRNMLRCYKKTKFSTEELSVD